MSEFNLGSLVVTDEVAAKMHDDRNFSAYVYQCITRHENADWGDCCAEDAQLNNEALTFGSDRLFSVYNPADHLDWRIWIITEWDRSVTTVLFPDEY